MPDDYENQNTETEEQESESENNNQNNQNNGDGKSRVNASATYPYMVAMTPSATSLPDYDRLKAARVRAIMFFGGELYD